MPKQPAKKSGGKKAKRSGKLGDLPAKSLGAGKASAVKGGTLSSPLKDKW